MFYGDSHYLILRGLRRVSARVSSNLLCFQGSSQPKASSLVTSLSPSLRHHSTRNRSPRRKRFISSLDPTKLQPSDYLDISGYKGVKCKLCPPRDGHAEGTMAHDVAIAYSQLVGGYIPFPPDTRGFLYYHYSPEDHFAAGALRFRLLETPDVASFSSGRDLTDKDGKTWGPHLLNLMKTDGYQGVHAALLEHGLISPATDAEVKKLLLGCSNRFNGKSDILDSITQPFVVDFSTVSLQGHVLDAESLHMFLFREPFVVGLDSQFTRSPYSGRAWVRLELGTISGVSGRPRPKVLMRVLKWVEPPNPESLLRQEEGQFVKKYHPVKRCEVLWNTNPDTFPEYSVQKLRQAYPLSSA